MLNTLVSDPGVMPVVSPCADRQLRICLLGYRSHPFSGGQGVYLRYLSKALVEAGHIVDVISGPPYPALDERVTLIRLPSLDLYAEDNVITALRPKHLASYTDLFEWCSMLSGGFSEPYTFGRRLVEYFAKVQPDYDIVHDNQSLCYGTLELQKQSIPLITTIHHPITRDLKIALENADHWWQRLLIRRWHSFLRMQKKVVSELEHVVVVSETSRKDTAAAFNISEAGLKVVHNGIDTEVFRPLPGVEPVPFRIMTTTSADQPLKGLQYLLRAIAKLKDRFPDIHLVVLGKLKPGGDSEQLIRELGLSKDLTFVSGIETEELVNLYAQASMAVVPSIYEGFGLPAGEAMACGVPLISTDGGALPEVVGDAGIIVPTRDSDALADAIELLCGAAQLRQDLAIKGRARIQKLFSWQVAAGNMVELYEDVLAESKA